MTSLLLASLGVYGLVADSARQREREVGVRLALGAKPSAIIVLFLKETRRIGSYGIVAGFTLAIALASVLRNNVFAVRVFDTVTFIGAAGVLLAVTVFAALLPAWRASQKELAVILRQE